MSLYEYNILKKRIEKIGEELYDKKTEFNRSSLPIGQGTCLNEYTTSLPSYSEWESSIEINRSVKCPEMLRAGGCTKTDCPGYKNYKEYIDIQRRFDYEIAKLDNFPFWFRINPPKVK